MKAKEQVPLELIDEYDNCANGEPCVAEAMKAAYTIGFEKARELALGQVNAYFDGEDCLCLEYNIEHLGEEEV